MVLNGLLILIVGRSLDVVIVDAGALPGGAGVLLGGGMLLAAWRLNTRPAGHVAWGAAEIILSVLSLVLVGGGFILGTVMGLCGGVLAMVWRG